MRSSSYLIDRAIVFFKNQVVVQGALPDAHSQSPAYPLLLEGRPYSELSDDVGLLLRVLEDLRIDLASTVATVQRHPQALDLLVTATKLLRQCLELKWERDQLISELEVVFRHLSHAENEISSSMETVMLHGFKLQHLDLATQMLTEVFAEIVLGTRDVGAGASKLHRLRRACEQALSGTAHSTSSQSV